MASFLSNPPQGPRLVMAISVDNQTGAGGGVPAGAVADFSQFLIDQKVDAFTAAGGTWFAMVPCFGRQVAGTEESVGMAPADDPGVTLAATGQRSGSSWHTRRTHETAQGGTAFTSQIVTSLDTAGRKGSWYGIHMFSSPVPISVDPTDTTELDYLTAIERTLGAIPSYDVQNTIYIDPNGTADRAVPYATGRQGWYQAQNGCEEANGDPCENNDAILNVLDKNLEAASYVQATAGFKPTFIEAAINGWAAIRFAGTDDRMQRTSAMTLTAHTIGVVAKPNSASDMMLMGLEGVNRQEFRMNELAAADIGSFDGTNTSRTNGSKFTNGAFSSFLKLSDGTYRVNGAAVVGYQTGPTAQNAMSLDLIGSFSGGSLAWIGDVAEWFLYNRVCGANEVALYHNHWATMYGLACGMTATLPHAALVRRLVNTHGVRPGGEVWPRNAVAGQQGWMSLISEAIEGDEQAVTKNADTSTYWAIAKLKANGIRAVIYMNASTSAANRLARMRFWMVSMRCDFWCDMSDFTDAQLGAAIDIETAAQSGRGTPRQRRRQRA